jgi:hypothetical protein
MTLKSRLVLCWVMTVAAAIMAVGAVMADRSTSSHRSVMAASCAFMIMLTGWHWSILPRVPSLTERSDNLKT